MDREGLIEMNDLINRQDAIDLVEHRMKHNPMKSVQFIQGLQDAYLRVISDLNRLPPADVPQWIPCSERLPEKPKPNDEFEGKPLDIYLVCKKGNIPFRAFWNGKNFTDGWTSLDVGAWMPLPDLCRKGRSR